MELTLDDLEHVACGAALLGTGGGGDPYIGWLLARQMLREYGPVTVIPVSEVESSWCVLPIAYMGAPTVAVEKLIDIQSLEVAFSQMEHQIGRPADAVISGEMGGVNSMTPICLAAKRGLPLVDGDGMGRAFPELPMGTFNIYGVSCSPVVLSNEHKEYAVFNARDAKAAETLARQIVIQMGGSVAMSCYPMTGEEVKRASVAGTLSFALQIGRAIEEGRRQGDPFTTLMERLNQGPHYGNCGILFEGKIADVIRETKRGFATGQIEIESFGKSETKMRIDFENEYLLAQCDGELRAVVPDLICILDQDSAEPVTTEGLRYGQRIKVLGIGAPSVLLTEKALQIVGPQNFGLEHSYQTIRFVHMA